MKTSQEIFAIYFIAGTQDIKDRTLPEVLEQALKAGITCFQYREKGEGSLTDLNDKKLMAKKCQQLCKQYQVPFLINDDVALALEIEADGIHVGQTDQAIQDVLALFSDKIVGLSCYDEKEVQAANKVSAITYYGIGPVYGTLSKRDAKQPIGLVKLQKLTQIAEKPVVAIGGINTKNVEQIIETSVAGVSVISAITQAEDVHEAVKRLS
ncbi:thiamine phosphate synthase [Enterococcus rotai]|uniref:thiamine phosphate synthase n=1 Tax=Enterococcus rotai TaxID=118060 RepID=UPI0035C67EBE